MGRAVAVVGGSRYLGAHLVGALLREPSIDKVVAIDSIKPSAQFRRRMGGAEVVRIDLQSPRLQGILREHAIDTVVHAGLHHNDFTPGGRAATKEANIMGSMHVIAAAGRASSVKRFVLLSSTSVYGSSGVDPVLFSEEMAARRSPGGGIPRDYLSVEGYVRGMNRKRPDIEVTILRMPAILGLPEPTVFGELLQPTITPVLAGYDPRIQLLHPADALDALVQAAERGPAGTFNIAADGVVTLVQAIRRAGHIPVPVLSPFFRIASGLLTGEGLKNIGPSQLQYLRYGRGVDNRRMRDVFGFEPRYTTEEALAAYFKDSGSHPMVSLEFVRKSFALALAATPATARPAMKWAFEQVFEEIAKPTPAMRAFDPANSVKQSSDEQAAQGSVVSSSASDAAPSSQAAIQRRSMPAGVAARRAGSRQAVKDTTAAIIKSRTTAPVTKRAAAKLDNTTAAKKRVSAAQAATQTQNNNAAAQPETVSRAPAAKKSPVKKATAKKATPKKTPAKKPAAAKAKAQSATNTQHATRNTPSPRKE